MSAFAPPLTSARPQFVTAIRDAFDEAGVEYVFLHGFDREARDSDVDVAVAREALATVDLLVRTGRLGRMLQRFDYDVPWCRYYVVATKEPERRYRQLDVACDPWGIGKYGPAVRVALAGARRVDGLSVPGPASEALYLAIKRARKRAGGDELKRLRSAFRADPEGASRLLQQEFGLVGEHLAETLESGEDLDSVLAALAVALGHRRRSPALLARRAQFETQRFRRRVMSPTGLVLGLAGPDGVGKSTLAEGLELGAIGAFRSIRRLHLSPGLLPPPARILGRQPATKSDPHGRAPSGRIGSSARVAYLSLDTLLGWGPRVALPRLRSSLIVLERGLADLGVDPRRYRLRRMPRLLSVVRRFMPRPDLTLLLDAPPAVVHGRRAELSLEEIDRQLAAWRGLAARDPRRFRSVDASAGAVAVLEQSLDLIDGALAVRQGRLELAATALQCLGGPSVGGEPHAIAFARGAPRWILPRHRDPVTAGVYRPASRLHHAAAVALTAGARAPGRAITIDQASGLAPPIAAELGAHRVELAAALPREDRRSGRVLLSVLREGDVVAFAKVDADAAALDHEASVLEAVRLSGPKRIVVPDVVGLLDWEGLSVLLLRALDTGSSTSRTMSSPEREALVELGHLSEQLACVLGREDGKVPVHGDFSGWNCSPLEDGRLALWDWEEARLGVPLEDFFHWQVARCTLMGRGDLGAIAQDALRPGPQLAELSRQLGVGPDGSYRALAACLERELKAGIPNATARELERALSLLEGGRG